MGIKEIKQGVPIFENTQEAIAYGEKANLEDMTGLFEKLAKVFINESIFLNFNIQMMNESVHAYQKDAWYEMNK